MINVTKLAHGYFGVNWLTQRLGVCQFILMVALRVVRQTYDAGLDMAFDNV
jgi:hypothetical protein